MPRLERMGLSGGSQESVCLPLGWQAEKQQLLSGSVKYRAEMPRSDGEI